MNAGGGAGPLLNEAQCTCKGFDMWQRRSFEVSVECF